MMMQTARRIYFASWYNTTSLVNVMLTLGVITPFIIMGALTHYLSLTGVISAVILTVTATYCYNLVYIVNDFIDRAKDQALGIPKLSARHVLGSHYLPIVLACFAAVIILVGLIFPGLLEPLALYCVALAGLSVLHSKVKSAKLITVFIERLAKFIMPLVFVGLALGTTAILPVLFAALLIFPLSHTFDYAYRGYIRDRLHRPQSIRYTVYAYYYGLLAIAAVQLWFHLPAALNLPVITMFAGLYGLISAFSDMLAPRLPLSRLDGSYNPPVAMEKRRLVTYGVVQSVLITLGGIYALLG